MCLSVRASRAAAARAAGHRARSSPSLAQRVGVGTSAIAANLAVSLRQLTGKKVVLVDGNLIFGDPGVIMNLVSSKTIADLANRIAELDRDLLNDILITHTTQVRVLLAPPNPQTGELVTSDHLRAILEQLRKDFDYVVVDTQSSFQDRALAVLDLADRIVTLMTLEMPCIKNIKLFLEVAELLEYPAEKVLLVLNKADSRLGIRVENVEENIQHKGRPPDRQRGARDDAGGQSGRAVGDREAQPSDCQGYFCASEFDQ